MAELGDRALGMAIRRRRTAVGLSQKDVAAAIDVPTVVYGRMELGNRPIKALELAAIAHTLGVGMESLIREVTPVTPEELVDRAATNRDAAASALITYGSAVVEAIAAVLDAHGAMTYDNTELHDGQDVIDYLRVDMPAFTGVTAPADIAPLVSHALGSLTSGISITSTPGSAD